MEQENSIPVQVFCTSCQLSYSFVQHMHEAGLIAVEVYEEVEYLPLEQVPLLEKLARMHTELGINPEGVEAIAHLLDRVDTLQQELKYLRDRLHLYEDAGEVQG